MGGMNEKEKDTMRASAKQQLAFMSMGGDGDCDGRVTEVEFERILVRVGITWLTREQMKARFGAMDADRSGRLNLGEILAAGNRVKHLLTRAQSYGAKCGLDQSDMLPAFLEMLERGEDLVAEVVGEGEQLQQDAEKYMQASSQARGAAPERRPSDLMSRSRLNSQEGWVAGKEDKHPWLAYRFKNLKAIQTIATQGDPRADGWVESYRLQYISVDKQDHEIDEPDWLDYADVNGQPISLQGNADRNTLHDSRLPRRIEAFRIRICPQEMHPPNHTPAMRATILGFNVPTKEISLMTFNVGKYYRCHSTHDIYADKPEVIRANAKTIWRLLCFHSPDIVCLQEHITPPDISEQDLRNLLTRRLGYEWFQPPPADRESTGCTILWKISKFRSLQQREINLADPKLGGGKKGEMLKVPGTDKQYRPRKAALVELEHVQSKRRLAVCSVHLMGGGFEEATFLAEYAEQHNIRNEQIKKINRNICQTCGERTPAVIAGDFNCLRDGYSEGSIFRSQANQHYKESRPEADALLRSSAMGRAGKAEDTIQSFSFTQYITFQRQPHLTLTEELDYKTAYGEADRESRMKSCQIFRGAREHAEVQNTKLEGCTDWVYVRGPHALRGRKDCSNGLSPQIVDTIGKGIADHNAVIVNLLLD